MQGEEQRWRTDVTQLQDTRQNFSNQNGGISEIMDKQINGTKNKELRNRNT